MTTMPGSAQLNSARIELRTILLSSAACGTLIFAAHQSMSRPALLLVAGGGGGGAVEGGNGGPGLATVAGGRGYGLFGGAGGAQGRGGAAGYGKTFSLGGYESYTGGGGGGGWWTGGLPHGGLLPWIPKGQPGSSWPTFRAGGNWHAFGYGGAGGGGLPFGGDGGGGGGGGGPGAINGHGGSFGSGRPDEPFYGGGGGGSFYSPLALWHSVLGGVSGHRDGKNSLGQAGVLYINGIRFGYTRAIGTYVFKTTGDFLLYGVGGQGGGGAKWQGDTGGYGAEVGERLHFTAGEELYFMVGGAGYTGFAVKSGLGDIHQGGQGGGGTFVWTNLGPNSSGNRAPEPSSWMTMSLGILGIGLALRRRLNRRDRQVQHSADKRG